MMAFMYCAVTDCFRICFPHQTLNSSRAEGKVCIANILNSYTRQDPWHVAGDQQVFMEENTVKERKEEWKEGHELPKATELGSREVGI